MVNAILFDLDNTLYSEKTGMEEGVVVRMNDFVARWLGVSREEGIRRRREGVRNHGTSLEWLMLDLGFDDPDAYFRAVHPAGEEVVIEPDPMLAALLDALPQAKAVLTNAPMDHAERVLDRLGVRDRFSAIYDIRFNDLVGKPAPHAFLRALDAFGFGIGETLFVDDLPKYVRGYADIGGRAVLKDEGDRFGALGIERVRSLHELPAIIASANGA